MKASLSYPSKEKVQVFLKDQSTKSFNYQAILGTKKEGIVGYDNDHNFIEIGKLQKNWDQAKAALNEWRQFPVPWTKIESSSEKIKEGLTVGVYFKIFGLWWINSARVVYTIDEPNKFGYAYGTLPGHLESGEECFWIERDDNGMISYHIRAFSKPDHFLVRLAYPIARMFQKKFVKESLKAMFDFANA